MIPLSTQLMTRVDLAPMRTNVYVDAFNLYYGCLKGTPYRWLDLRRSVAASCQTTRSTASGTLPHSLALAPTTHKSHSASSPIFAPYGPSRT